MTIDTERLKHDESLWLDGATHYNEHALLWIKFTGVCAYYWDGDWQLYKSHDRFARHMKSAIPRPTKPEWVDGLPPDNTICEFQYTDKKSDWRKCYVFAIRGETAWLHMSDNDDSSLYPMFRLKFRPLKSDAERLREELAETLAECVTMQCGTMMDDWQYDLIANALLNSDKFNVTRK